MTLHKNYFSSKKTPNASTPSVPVKHVVLGSWPVFAKHVVVRTRGRVWTRLPLALAARSASLRINRHAKSRSSKKKRQQGDSKPAHRPRDAAA